ncbi:unnamed protein product [Rhizoctonia solani]|uniref:RNA helicase n=1 Tax=Rhizoctonia solani TaxID=456999 RepID=A0A8H3AZQ7_9AGAM|nr:unnamed protein product [Rhizoctonia solani]
MCKIRTVVLDDIDKLIEAGMEAQILEVYRYIPPLVQIVASATVFSLSVAKVTAKLQADPLQILVDRDEGISIGTHFYIMVSSEQKSSALLTLFSTLGHQGLVLLCRDFTQITGYNWSEAHQFYYMRESMEPDERQSIAEGFESKASEIKFRRSNQGYSYGIQPKKRDPVAYVALVATDTGLSTTRSLRLNYHTPLINYEITNNAEEYIKRLN